MIGDYNNSHDWVVTDKMVGTVTIAMGFKKDEDANCNVPCTALKTDVRTVEAKTAFINEYNRLYFEKHGCYRTEDEKLEKSIDDLAGLLHSLVVAFIERDKFPEWAEHAKSEAINGNLLLKAEQLLS